MAIRFTARTEPRNTTRTSPLCSGVASTLEDTLQYRLQYEVPDRRRDLYQSLTFYLQIRTFLVEPRGFEPLTSAAKAARYFARGFWSLQNACKSPYLLVGAFLKVSGYLLRLLHGCCTDCKACTRTRSGMIAIGLEGRDSTKAPRCFACLRTPTKGRTQSGQHH